MIFFNLFSATTHENVWIFIREKQLTPKNQAFEKTKLGWYNIPLFIPNPRPPSENRVAEIIPGSQHASIIG